MPVLSFADFTGGLWLPGDGRSGKEEDTFAIPDNALLKADNIDFLPGGGVRARRGSTKYNTSAEAASILVLARLYPRPVATGEMGTGTADWEYSGSVGNAKKPWLNAFAAEQINFRDFNMAQSFLQAQDGTPEVYQSNYLVFTNPFQGRIPEGASFTDGALTVRIWRCADLADAVQDVAIAFTTDGAPSGFGGNDAALLPSPTYWPLVLADALYVGDNIPAGADPLWGLSAASIEASINSDDFKLYISCENANVTTPATAKIDYVLVTASFSVTPAKKFISAHNNLNLKYRVGSSDSPPGTWSDVSVIDADGNGTSLDVTTYRPMAVNWPEKGRIFLFDGVNPVCHYPGPGLKVQHVATSANLEGIAPRRGPYACLHQSRLWATDPNELQFSVYACHVNDETLWYPDVHLSFNDPGAGTITGLASFRDSLLVFKDTSVHNFIGNVDPVGNVPLGSQRRISTEGCVAPYSIQITDMGAIYVGREGVWLTDGEGVVEISRPIRDLFTGRETDTVYTNAVGIWYPRRKQYWLKLDPTTSPGYVAHYLGDRWAWTRIPVLPMNCGLVWAGRGDTGQLYIGDTAGFVWLRDTGDTSADDTITPHIITKAMPLDPERRHMGRVFQVRPFYRSESALTVGVRYDQKELDEVDDVSAGFTETSGEAVFREPRKYINNKTEFGRHVSATATTAAEGASLELHRIDLDVQMRGYKPWR